MELAQTVKKQIEVRITEHLKQGGSFPFEVNHGPFSHTISEKELPGKLLISTVDFEGKAYLVNMGK